MKLDAYLNKIIISIDDGSEFEISYGVTCVDDDFNNFVTIGDSVMKEKGTKVIKFIKADRRNKVGSSPKLVELCF